MTRIVWTALAGVMAGALLAGCSEGGGAGSDRQVIGEFDARSSVTTAGARMAAAPPPPAMAEQAMESGGGASQAPAEAGDPESYLAYRYDYSVRLPGEGLAGLHGAHVATCEAAGLGQCQVVHASTQNAGTENARANLRLRAAPAWIARFREGLAAELEGAGGTVISEQTGVEDLTTQIVDGEARLRARIALRDRLQAMLEQREARLEELIQVERELARVQSDIEARESVIAALRLRVSMSELSVAYHPQLTPASASNFEPVSEAIESMSRTFAESVAALISFLAALLPWLVLIIPGAWLIRRWVRKGLERRRARRAGETG
ncbi:DUF4349 domain-containing protein [Hyphomonadaceae bacterium ML37]|nr:DUF4349 domain-containing protein [Hyphomonadaceae bacterium ML37]